MRTKRSLALWGLVASLWFLGLGGLYGGVGMLLDVSGRALGMDVVLPLLPVPDYLLPGLFLVAVMGLAPLVLTVGLLRPRGAHRIGRRHWAWTGTVLLGAVLGAWLALQAAFIGFRWPIQYATAVTGAAIVALALSPQVRAHADPSRSAR